MSTTPPGERPVTGVATGDVVPAAPAASPRRGLSRRRSQVLVGLLCAVLGFALVTQVRSTRDETVLAGTRQDDLVRILDDLGSREERLRREIDALTETRSKLLSGSTAEAADEARKRGQTLGILAGTVPAKGPGIVLTIGDPGKQVDAALLLNALEELRDAGAEAVQIGPVRVGASTYFRDRDGAVEVDGQVLRAPFVIVVIGDPETLSQALDIPGGVVDEISSIPGASSKVERSAAVVIDALRALDPPQYARPAPAASPGG